MAKREHVSEQQQLLYGHADVPARKDLETGWKAAKAIAAGGHPLGDAARHCLIARMAAAGVPAEVVEHVMGWDERAERLEAPLARVTSAHGTRAWILYEGLSVAIVEGGVTDGQLDAAHAVAAALDLTVDAVDELAEVCRQERDLRVRRLNLLSATSTSGYRFDLL